MSLSSDPALSVLKNYFVCGYKDITGQPYSGVSGRHEVGRQAINTTNGAGPHNLQLFVMAPDGTVLHCLPGFWNPADLVQELELANDLYTVYKNPSMTRSAKEAAFRQMQLAHVQEHSPLMVRRSRMQGFDQKFEAKHRLYTSDTIANPTLVAQNYVEKGPMSPAGFKTTDQIVHERMSQRPFVPYERFDTAQFVDYGRPKYEKHEDHRDQNGRLTSNPMGDELIGNVQQMRRSGQGRRQFMGRRGFMANYADNGQWQRQ